VAQGVSIPPLATKIQEKAPHGSPRGAFLWLFICRALAYKSVRQRSRTDQEACMLEFQAEIQAFEAALPGLLQEHDGKFAVIRGDEVEPQVFPTYEAALDWGYDRFGLERFFVKQITDKAHATHFMRGFTE
jgi:hypothetical protein